MTVCQHLFFACDGLENNSICDIQNQKCSQCNKSFFDVENKKSSAILKHNHVWNENGECVNIKEVEKSKCTQKYQQVRYLQYANLKK